MFYNKFNDYFDIFIFHKQFHNYFDIFIIILNFNFAIQIHNSYFIII